MSFSFTWQPQTLMDSDALESACRQYHHAAQFLASFAQSLLPALADDRHTNLEWLAPRHALASRWVNDEFRLVLNYPRFVLRLENRAEEPLVELLLEGNTKSSVLAWLREEVARLNQGASQVDMISHYQLPAHPLDTTDAVFVAPDDRIQEELRRYRANAEAVLQAVRAEYAEQASEVRTWPHHYDSATLIALSHHADGELKGSVGVGLAIPDGVTSGFYYYIKPWRKDKQLDMKNLPDLTMGQWRTDGFTGAVLELSRLALIQSPTQQQTIVQSFFDKAIRTAVERVQA